MGSKIQQAKAARRKQVRAALAAISPEQRKADSARICARLREQPVWKNARFVLMFAPLPTEPDLWPLLLEAISSGKRVALPRFIRDIGEYAPFLIQDVGRDLVSGQLGIREPGAHCPPLVPPTADLILVPGVAFDLTGHRLGRGKGFYDRLLKSIRGPKCGVAFDQQVVREVPAEPHDVRLDYLLTPTRWVKF